MDVWDVVIMVAAAYVAVSTLVGLMRRRRDAVLDDLSHQAEAERQRRLAEQRREQRQELRRKLREQQNEDAV